jgi:hypothetical protein
VLRQRDDAHGAVGLGGSNDDLSLADRVLVQISDALQRFMDTQHAAFDVNILLF